MLNVKNYSNYKYGKTDRSLGDDFRRSLDSVQGDYEIFIIISPFNGKVRLYPEIAMPMFSTEAVPKYLTPLKS